MNLEKELPGVKKNISLANYTTFGIGGRSKYFFAAKAKNDLIMAIKVARKFALPFFVLGGGSNLLISDKGFNGLVIKIQNTKYKIQNTKIIAEAGVKLGELVSVSTIKGMSGLEWAAGIPGTIGGAVYGNAGAFGYSMANIVKSVEVLEIFDEKMQNVKRKMKNENVKFKIKKFRNSDCQFGYRDSVFKNNKNLIILSVVLQLKKGNKKGIENKIKEFLKHRKETQPLNFPSAGSVFKNPKGFFAGELIEKCGLKGKKNGNVKISEKHCNFFINLGKGKAGNVRKLINLTKKRVEEKFGVILEEEIRYLGF